MALLQASAIPYDRRHTYTELTQAFSLPIRTYGCNSCSTGDSLKGGRELGDRLLKDYHKHLVLTR